MATPTDSRVLVPCRSCGETFPAQWGEETCSSCREAGERRRRLVELHSGAEALAVRQVLEGLRKIQTLRGLRPALQTFAEGGTIERLDDDLEECIRLRMVDLDETLRRLAAERVA